MTDFWLDTVKKLDARDTFSIHIIGEDVHVSLVRSMTSNDCIAVRRSVYLQCKDVTYAVQYATDDCIRSIRLEEELWRASQSAPPLKSKSSY